MKHSLFLLKLSFKQKSRHVATRWLILVVNLLVSVNINAQKASSFTEQAKIILQQDKRVAAFEMNADRGTPESVRFESWNTYPASETGKLLQQYFTSRSGVDAYTVKNETVAYGGIKIVRYQQYFKGIKVEFGEIVVVSKNDMLGYLMAENYVPEEGKTVSPTLVESSALNKAITNTGASRYAWQENSIKKEEGGAYPKGELVLMPDMRKNRSGMVLAWKFDIYATKPLSRDEVYISAEDGSLIFKNAIIKHANATGTAATRYSGTKSITTNSTGTNYQLKETSTFMNGIETYNMNRGTNYSTSVIPTDNDNNWTAAEYNNANKDNALLDAHWGAEQVVAYWKAIHNRNSYNNSGAVVKSYVHYDNGYDNAYWDGSVMTYGDGSGGTNGFSPLTSLDVCAHEIGHAVCSSTSNLVYSNESGAMNEGFSDIWGACLENYADPANTTYEPFLIGEQISYGWVKGTNRNALRDMANPPAQGNPDTYGGTNWSYNEVHNRSGVLNKWFYLITHGESGTNDLGNAYNVTGQGFAKSQLIAFLTEVSLTPNATYAAARTAAIGAATTLYGSCVPEVQSVINAWYAVGVGPVYNAGTCGTKIQFLSAGTTVYETVASNACHPGKTITGTVLVLAPVSTNATVTLISSGTARLGKDFTIDSTSFLFTPGGPLRHNFTITVYDNAIDEGDRTLQLTYMVTGGATAGSENQSYTLQIRDDDAAPSISTQPTVDYTTISESFTGLTALPTGWSTRSNIATAGSNIWTVGSNAATISSGNALYITNNGSTKPWTYTKTSTSDVTVLLPELDAANLTNIRFNFRYIAKGEKYNTTLYDYGSLVYSLDSGATIIDYPNISYYNVSVGTAVSLALPDGIFANKRFRLGFRWRNDNQAGTDPPFGIDDVSIQVTRNLTNVETALYANKDEYVDASSPVYFLSNADKKIMARIINSSKEAGCVNATITSAGNGQATLTYGLLQYKRSAKVVTFTPSTPDSTITNRVRLYFSPDEIAVWGTGLQRSNLKMAMVKNGVDLNGPLAASDIQIITPIFADEQSGVWYYEGDFTGWGQLMLISPAPTGASCSGSSNITTLYVDSSRAESGDGMSWQSAYKTLNNALLVANTCTGIQQILVAKGTYYPILTGALRDSSFRILRNGIKLYGGYPTGGGARNVGANPTILSGNIGNRNSATDNSYHILTIMAQTTKPIDTTTRVDGFTFTGGRADSFTDFYVNGETQIWQDNGGGIYCYGQNSGNSCKPYILNCVFYNNLANNRGGAIFNEGYSGGSSSPTIMNCAFYSNSAGYATGSSGDYGGGGAVFNNGPLGTSSPSVINCSFYGNTANIGLGGGMTDYGNSIPTIINSIVYGNTNNTGESNVWNVNGATFNITYSIVGGGPGGGGNINANPLFVNPAVGDLRLQGCSPAINAGNSAAVPAGTTMDVAGNTRLFNAAVDMGAYENVTLPATFTFKGAGNWNVIGSWQCNWVPPSPLPSGYEIIVDPIGGDCLLNVPFTVGPGGKLTVKTGKKLVVQGNLQVQ